MFKLVSNYKPSGDQPQAIDELVNGINEGKKFQTLLGVTGSGKTEIYMELVEEVEKLTGCTKDTAKAMVASEKFEKLMGQLRIISEVCDKKIAE